MLEVNFSFQEVMEMNILVVSDSAFRWLKLAKILREADYFPQLAEKKAEAINLFPEVDLILVDGEGNNGNLEFCRELRCRGYHRPLILMGLESLEDVRRSGADEWLELPLFAPEVVMKVELLLTRYQLWTNQTMSNFCQSFCTISPSQALKN